MPILNESSPPPGPKLGFIASIRQWLLGGRRNPHDPQVFQHISLIAFFAWVGIGADGISSANYGPEEAFLALEGIAFLVPILAVLIAATVWIISLAYIQVIEQFPMGGGGYLVASKLLSPKAGAIAGSGLIIDYVLTIAVSVVAGVDAIFSIVPSQYDFMEIYCSIGAICLLVFLNLRGVKEAVLVLLPIFLVFVVTHVGLVTYGLFAHFPDFPERTSQSYGEASTVLASQGLIFIVIRLIHAFSMGAGTLTGIEAVSNSMMALKEPRVQTGKRTMILMATSLSFLATMLLLNYFLYQTKPVAGKTLNAVLFEQITGGWTFGTLDFGDILVTIMLISAALLLLVAAQTGFIDGPRVLSNMAQDSWLPHRFGHLSERLVTQNGILLMGFGAILFIIYARNSITVLVSLYAINVFMDFTLAQLGMSKLWLSRRKTHPQWFTKFAICAVGLGVSALLLSIMIVVKFSHGGWLIALITLAFFGLCLLIRKHYHIVENKIKELDTILATLPLGESAAPREPLNPHEPTAVILVQKYGGQGVHVLLNVQRLFGNRFKQFIFLSVGAIDSGRFKGVDELAHLRKEVEEEAEKYVLLARSYGMKAEARTTCELDYVTEIERLCLQVHREFPNTVFFAARLLFWRDTYWTRFLHNETPMTLQRRLMFHGLQFVVLPVRLQ